MHNPVALQTFAVIRSVKKYCFIYFYLYVVWFSLEDIITTNNTEILITDIGEDAPGGLPSLTCHTDGVCCKSKADKFDNGGLGQWTYPDGSVILKNAPSATAGDQFYTYRNDAQLIRLARREANKPFTPTGSYCCTVPTKGRNMTLCANLGEWIGIKVLYFSSDIFTIQGY